MGSRPIAILSAAFGLSLVGAAPAAAVTWDAEAKDDHIAIRGDAREDFSGLQSTPGNSTSTRVTNCVPIGNGQLRCYAVDLAADPLNGIAAASVIPAAAGPTIADIAAAAVTELRRLPIASGGITIQPSRGWTLVNLDTIVLTNPAPQTFDTTVLGVPVTVRALPTRYSWDFGDGTAPLVTTQPGRAWPDPTVSHVYRNPGTRTVTLTTQWSGQFLVGGSTTWQPIAGVATTTETAPAIEVRAAENSLVTRP